MDTSAPIRSTVCILFVGLLVALPVFADIPGADDTTDDDTAILPAPAILRPIARPL